MLYFSFLIFKLLLHIFVLEGVSDMFLLVGDNILSFKTMLINFVTMPSSLYFSSCRWYFFPL